MAIALLLGLLSGVLLVAAVLAWAWQYAVVLAVGTALLMLAGKIAERSDRKKLSASKRS